MQGLITDGILQLLLHEDWHVLDLSGCVPGQLTSAGLLHALQHLPLLAVLDISR